MNVGTLTDEDTAIFQRIAPELSACVCDDDIDFRAMMAREVESERLWRIRGIASTPAMFVHYELPGLNLRIKVERDSGETL